MSDLAERRPGSALSEPSVRDILDAFPAAVYTTDAEGRITFFNKAAEELAGRTPKLLIDKWCVTWKLRNPDGEEIARDACPMAVALKEGRAVRNVEVVAERPNGDRVPLMPFPTPMHDAAGNLIGAVNMLVDISALKRAEASAARRADEQAALFAFTNRLYRTESAEDIYAAALDAIAASLRCSRASILLFDEAGVMRFVASRNLSPDYCKAVEGHSPWKMGEREPQASWVDDVAAADLPDDLRAAVAREGIGALAFIPLTINGAVIGKFMAYHNVAHTFEPGEINIALTIARQLGFAIERSRARDYRHGAEEVRERLIAIVENSDDAIISKDLNGTIVSWNKGAERIFGYAPEEIIGRPVTTLMSPQQQDEEPGILDRIRRGERIDHYETVRRRKDGASIDISLTVSPVKDVNGNIIGASKIARDITERRRAEMQRTLLINELNHRVKNTLATVQSLAMQTLRSTERSADARDLFDSRLSALSRAHDLLTTQNWEGADLYDVVDRALKPFAAEAARFVVAGPNVRLSTKQALALSIALHELATNAAKYGALSNETGCVTVEWSIAPNDNQGELHLTWTESGGPRVERPTRVGFGSRLIERSLAHELGGAALIEYRPEGVVSTISSPLEFAA